jgi:hypothetical protein
MTIVKGKEGITIFAGLRRFAVIDMWGDQADVLFGMHHWPVWGKAALREHLERQRDMYRYINDETLRLANRGYTMRRSPSRSGCRGRSPVTSRTVVTAAP